MTRRQAIRGVTGYVAIVLGACPVLVSLSAPAAAQQAQALINPDRPGIADGSTTVGANRFQIETAIQAEFRGDDGEHDRTIFVPTLLRYGISKRWEVRVEGNGYTWVTQKDPATGTSHASGFAPTSIGLKYNFLDASGAERPSIGAILRIFPPSGSGDFRTHVTTGDFRLAADWNFADQWSLNPNVGVGIYEDDANRVYHTGLFATTLNFNPSQVLNFFVDTGVQTNEAKHGATSVILDAGTAYIIGRDIQLDLSIGTGAAGATPPHPFVAAGFSKRF
jgi:hypothetical protein